MLFSVLVSLCYQCQATHALKGAKPPAIFWLPLVPQTLLLPPPFENLPFTTPLFLCFQPLIHTNKSKVLPSACGWQASVSAQTVCNAVEAEFPWKVPRRCWTPLGLPQL